LIGFLERQELSFKSSNSVLGTELEWEILQNNQDEDQAAADQLLKAPEGDPIED
jgi:hypothetical protein